MASPGLHRTGTSGSKVPGAHVSDGPTLATNQTVAWLGRSRREVLRQRITRGSVPVNVEERPFFAEERAFLARYFREDTIDFVRGLVLVPPEELRRAGLIRQGGIMAAAGRYDIKSRRIFLARQPTGTRRLPVVTADGRLRLASLNVAGLLVEEVYHALQHQRDPHGFANRVRREFAEPYRARGVEREAHRVRKAVRQHLAWTRAGIDNGGVDRALALIHQSTGKQPIGASGDLLADRFLPPSEAR